MSPSTSFSTVKFFSPSLNPSCLRCTNFPSKLLRLLPLLVPPFGALACRSSSVQPSLDGCAGFGGPPTSAEGKVADEDRNPGPNRASGLGGGGGGLSSVDLVLPVLLTAANAGMSPTSFLCWYFCLMNFSIAPSTSSGSRGIVGFTFRGFRWRLEAVLPTLFIA